MSNMQIAELLQWIQTQWSLIPKQYLIVMYFGGTVFAFLNCFMGYRLRKVWGCILGILIGGGAGAGAGYFILQDKMLAIICAAAGALVLGLLAWLLYKFGVFFMCTGLVYFMVSSLFANPVMKHHVIALILGVFAGTFALGYETQMVIGITAVCGGIGGNHLLMKMLEIDAGKGEIVLGLIMAAIGIAVQVIPFTRGKDWNVDFLHLPSRRKKKKIVHETKVTHIHKNEQVKSVRKKTDEESNSVQQKDYYLGTGIGIDLDDLNRELSQEIQKICEEDQKN